MGEGNGPCVLVIGLSDVAALTMTSFVGKVLISLAFQFTSCNPSV